MQTENVYGIWFPEVNLWYNDHARNPSDYMTYIPSTKLAVVERRAKHCLNNEYTQRCLRLTKPLFILEVIEFKLVQVNHRIVLDN